MNYDRIGVNRLQVAVLLLSRVDFSSTFKKIMVELNALECHMSVKCGKGMLPVKIFFSDMSSRQSIIHGVSYLNS